MPRRLPRPAPPLEAEAEGNQAKQEEEEGLSGGGGTKRTRGCSCGRETYVRIITAEKVFFRNMKFKQKKCPLEIYWRSAGGERREKGREKEEGGKGGKIYADPHKDQGRFFSHGFIPP